MEIISGGQGADLLTHRLMTEIFRKDQLLGEARSILR
jgi:hypothetical protein